MKIAKVLGPRLGASRLRFDGQEDDAEPQEWHRGAQLEARHPRGLDSRTYGPSAQAKSGSLLEYRAEGEGDLQAPQLHPKLPPTGGHHWECGVLGCENPREPEVLRPGAR